MATKGSSIQQGLRKCVTNGMNEEEVPEHVPTHVTEEG